ncbi:unnamed protein product, partial [Pocillopora meandrina]
MDMMNQLKEDLNTKRTDVTVEILVVAYDICQNLNVKKLGFLLEQKNNVLIKETEKPKGDEANAKKTEQGPRPSMLSSTTSVPTSETFVQDTCLRKRHKGDQNKGFCCDSKTADPFSMSTAEKGGPIRLHLSPLPPIFARLSTSEVGRAKKDDNWLVGNNGNFLPFSQKEEYYSKGNEKSDDESSVKKMSPVKKGNSSTAAEKAGACRSIEESHPSCKTNDKKSSAK